MSEKAKSQLQRFHHLRPCQCKDTKETHLQLMFKFTVEMTLNLLRSEGVPQVSPGCMCSPKAGLLRAGLQGAEQADPVLPARDGESLCSLIGTVEKNGK